MKIPERLPKSVQGLRAMIQYVKKNYDVKKVLEIGSWTGLSAIEFAKEFEKVYCVEPFEATKGLSTKYDMAEVEKIFDTRVKKYDNIKKYKMTSEQARIELSRHKFDLVYIDGFHSYENVKLDLNLWLDRTKIVIAGHDYWRKKFPGVIKAVNEVLGKPDKIFADTSWIKKIKEK